MANRITGRVEVLANGKLLLNKAGAKIGGIGISGVPPVKRTAIQGDTGTHGYMEESVTPYCEVKLTDRSDVLLSELASIQGDGTIIFRALGGGKVYTLDQVTCVNDMTVTGGEGEVEVRFEGRAWIETVSAT